MRKATLIGLVMVLMVLGAASVSSAQGGPVIEKIWAPAEVNFGSVLKVYIKATDPEGDMKFLVVSGGKGDKATGSVPLRLGKDMKKELNGFVYYDTGKVAQRDVTGTVFIMIEDQKGNESETKSVPVKIVAKGAKAEKPPADFKEFAIGPVMIEQVQRPY